MIKKPITYRLSDPGRFNCATYYDGDDTRIEPGTIVAALNNADQHAELVAKVEAYEAMLGEATEIRCDTDSSAPDLVWEIRKLAGESMFDWQTATKMGGGQSSFLDAFDALRGEE